MQENYQNYRQPEGGGMNNYPPPKKDIKPLLSMIFGIAGIVVGCCCALAGVGLGSAAVIIGALCMAQKLQAGKGFYIAGFTTGIVAVVLHILNMILGFILNMSGFYEELFNMF